MFYDLKSTTYRIVDMMQAVTTVDLRDGASKFSGTGNRFFISSPVTVSYTHLTLPTILLV